MSIDAGAQVAIILLACRPCVVIVNCLGQVLYLGRAPRTNETLPDFHECRVGYLTYTSIPRVDGLSMDTPVLGRHISFLKRFQILHKYLSTFILTLQSV